VAGNVARILSICLVAAWVGPGFALGTFHDYSGYVVFVVAIALMVVCGEAIGRVAARLSSAGKGDGPADDSVDAAPATEGAGLGARVVPILAVLLLLPVFVFQSVTPMPRLMPAPEFALPERLPGGIRGERIVFCQNAQCGALLPEQAFRADGTNACPRCGAGKLCEETLAERKVLPADTKIVKRLYRSPLGEAFLVSAVIGGASKSSLHRPELCLPAQGYLIRDARNLEAGGRPFHAIRLERAGMAPAVHAYTYFNQNGVRTASQIRRNFLDTWARSVSGRIDRWVMLTVTAYGLQGFSLERPADRRTLESFLGVLAKELP